MNTAFADSSSTPPAPSKTEWKYYAVLGLLIVALWIPRVHGPIDMRWDGGVYYVLGTSIAEGKGYRLLNEPGEIEAIQYPPLLPLIVTLHQKVLNTTDPWEVGRALRVFSFVIFFAYINSVFLVMKQYLPLKVAFLGTMICLFHTNTYFMSDLLFPEVFFGLVTTSFVLLCLQGHKRRFAIGAALLGMIAFGLRTVGIALLIAWVAESLLNKNIKQAAIRFGVALVPLLCWQGYILFVTQGTEYNHPAYNYQRAAYMFYNVSYAKNIFTFKDPFNPELGTASVQDFAARFIDNQGHIPPSLGEAVSSKRIAYEIPWKFLDLPFPISTPWPVDVFLWSLGSIVLVGLGFQLKRRQWLLPLYVLFSIGILCLTPWTQQFPRYLMPLTPFLVLSLLTALRDAPELFKQKVKWSVPSTKLMALVVSIILLQHTMTVIGVYTRRHQHVTYEDRTGNMMQYKMFYYRDAHRALDKGLDWLRERATSSQILAGSMPHWMYLRTGLKSVMPPFEMDPVKAQSMLDSVPVTYLFQDEGLAVDTTRYIAPVINQFPHLWEKVYFETITPDDQKDPPKTFAIYRRVDLAFSPKNDSSKAGASP